MGPQSIEGVIYEWAYILCYIHLHLNILLLNPGIQLVKFLSIEVSNSRQTGKGAWVKLVVEYTLVLTNETVSVAGLTQLIAVLLNCLVA